MWRELGGYVKIYIRSRGRDERDANKLFTEMERESDNIRERK